MNLITKQIKSKFCAWCAGEFVPFKTTAMVCSINCAISYNSDRNWNKEKKVLKEKMKTKKDYLKEAQKVFNAYIRERDKNEGCISCGTKSNVKYDAGHYYHSNYSYLRFNELNVNKQCSNNCNVKLSGNLVEYRIGLIKKIGIEQFEKLENDRHKKLELSIPELIELKNRYKLKLKQLKVK